jgi:hypothetical protein
MRSTVLFLVAALLCAGCGRSVTAPEPFNPSGTLSFTYSGAINGTFAATGELAMPQGDVPAAVTGAGAWRQQDQLAFAASRADGVHVDVFSLILGDVTQNGTFTINVAACVSTPAQCRVGFFLPQLDVSELSSAPDVEALRAWGYTMIAGDVTVSSISTTRVKGTFRGLAVRGTEVSLLNTITITNGTFDLPLRVQ